MKQMVAKIKKVRGRFRSDWKYVCDKRKVDAMLAVIRKISSECFEGAKLFCY